MKSKKHVEQAQPIVRIVTTNREHALSQSEQSGLAAAQVTISMALERLEVEFPSLWVREIELFPCPADCKHC